MVKCPLIYVHSTDFLYLFAGINEWNVHVISVTALPSVSAPEFLFLIRNDEMTATKSYAAAQNI